MSGFFVVLLFIIFERLLSSSSKNELEWVGKVPFTFKTLSFVIIASKYVGDNSYYVNNVKCVDTSDGESLENSYEPKSFNLKKFCKIIEVDNEFIDYNSLFKIVCEHSGTHKSTEQCISGISAGILYAILDKR